MLSEAAIQAGELRIPLAQLDDAAEALVGRIDGIESPAVAKRLLAAWLSGACEQLAADAATYATSPQRGFATRLFTDALERYQRQAE